MEALSEFGVFFGKVLVLFLFFAGLALFIVVLSMRAKHKPQFEVENLNEKFDDIKSSLKEVMLNKKQLKALAKNEKAEKAKKEKDETETAKAFYLTFEGDLTASQSKELRDEISAVLQVAKPGDEVVVSVESPGGTVNGYGLAAAELIRVRDAGLKLIVCVDKIAASGGYMMACTAHRIYSAPFAVVGSIGVIAQIPNVHKLLKKHNVDYEEVTSGEYKKTVSIFGEITEKGRAKFQEQIQDTHVLFKSWVHTYRPQLNVEKVGTGEYWFGMRAIELNLVDEIKTSDQYLEEKMATHTVYKVRFMPKKSFSEKISEAMSFSIAKAANTIADRFIQKTIL